MIYASIVVHNTPSAQLQKVLDCLHRSEIKKIFVIDNGPGDTLKETSLNYPEVEYKKVENHGFGAGHNIAINEATKDGADYHLVLNADVWWDGDIIAPLAALLDKNKDVGLISPKTFYPDGSLQFTCRMLPTPVDLFFKRFLPDKLSKKRMSRYLLEDHDHDKELNCPYLLGSFMFFRVEALKQTGLFDERFFMYPEDIDITRRLHENWKTLYYPGVSIIHEHQQASKKNWKMFRIHFINMVKYFNKWGWWVDSKRTRFNKAIRKE